MDDLPVITANPEINAALVLSSGLFFFGQGVGKLGKAKGEICFNTSHNGYQEILTDPSYTGQIITFTAPHIGNVGANKVDNESSEKYANGLVLRADITTQSNFRAELSFDAWLKDKGLTGISGVDTRAITTHLRDKGACEAVVFYAAPGEKIDIKHLLEESREIESLKGMELASKVTTKDGYDWKEAPSEFFAFNEGIDKKYKVTVIDYGVKHNILNCLSNYGLDIKIVNCKTSAAEILADNPHGIFLSNGPGDPDATKDYAVPIIKELIESGKPIFGICMGHQLLSLAFGLKTFKMETGHRGGNHPVKNLLNGKVEITSQNHGFCVDDKDLPEGIEITHRSLFDNTVEGIRHETIPAFSVQYHPESSPGPHDSRYLFTEFFKLVEKHA